VKVAETRALLQERHPPDECVLDVVGFRTRSS
jgi:hypothetical protein